MKPLNLESFFLFIKNISILKNLTDFRKTAETGVDPRLHPTIFVHFLPAHYQPFVLQQWLGQIHLRRAHIPYGNDQDYLQMPKIRYKNPQLSTGVNLHTTESNGTNIPFIGDSNLSVICAGLIIVFIL